MRSFTARIRLNKLILLWSLLLLIIVGLRSKTVLGFHHGTTTTIIIINNNPMNHHHRQSLQMTTLPMQPEDPSSLAAAAAAALESSNTSPPSTLLNENNIFHSFVSNKKKLPKLIVFDLDNTLWTPELYTLRRNNIQQPIAGTDVHLFPGAQTIIQQIREYQNIYRSQSFFHTDHSNSATNDNYLDHYEMIHFAIASRTKSIDWAYDLLHQFQIQDLFTCIEIFPADKKQHFDNLHQKSHISYHDMLFFDDARDGIYGNCVSAAELGVLAVHCPYGLQTIDLFRTALEHFQSIDDGVIPKNTIIERDGTITYLSEKVEANNHQRVKLEGHVDTVYHDRRYGFIRYNVRQRIFFHFNNIRGEASGSTTGSGTTLFPQEMIQIGDAVSFDVAMDQKKGKPTAINIVIQDRATTTSKDNDTIMMLCFSMNMPFVALLANKFKTLESRNGTMFVPYPEGTIMTLHVGRRTYPDGGRHLEIMKSRLGSSDKQQIEQYKSLPEGYHPGMIVAICQLGTTIEMTLEQRSVREIEQQIVAYGSDSGKMITEIRHVQYLKRPLVRTGQAGIYKVETPIDVIPDEFLKLIKEQSENEK